jgi:O-antigen/teichoic acid export membrane protein
VICAGWLLNSFNIPSYMINLGTGDLKWNVISSVTIGILNLIFCGIVGMIYHDGLYIILTWITVFVFGSWIIIIEYHIRNKIAFTVLFNKVFLQFSFYFLLLIVVSYFINTLINNTVLLIILQGLVVGVYCTIIFFRIKEIKEIINQIILNKEPNN